MSYSKQNFTTGQVLTAEHLNNIEKGIVANENAIAEKQPKGDYATEGFVTDKIAEAQLGGNGTNVDLSAYAKTEDIAKNYQPKGNYLTEHQKIKTINGQSLVGEGNIQVAAQNKTGFEGKVISVLGDSISTYKGYIPVADGFNEEHPSAYPGQDVTNVNYTWWMQVINALDAKLGINDSWSGSRVHNYSTEENPGGNIGTKVCMASMTRITNLGSNGTPDVILFYGGTNDGKFSTVGTFDSTKVYDTVDLEATTWTSFADAYTAAVMRIQHLYPKARLICITPMFAPTWYNHVTLDNFVDTIVEICNYFGVPCIDLRRCGLNYANISMYLGDGLHPNKAGMTLVANYVLAQLKSECVLEEGENVVYSVTNDLNTVINSKPQITGVSSGSSYVTTLIGSTDFTGVTVHMGGTNITNTALTTNGNISISKVTGNIVISDNGYTPPAEIEVTAITSSNGINTATIEKGNAVQLGVTYTPSNTTQTGVNWTTSSESIAKVSNTGVVTGVTAGSATIIATSKYNNNLTAVWTVTVNDNTGGGDTGDGDTGGSDEDLGVELPTETTWYVDFTNEGGNFNFGNSSGAVTFSQSDTYNKCVGVPINAVKLMVGNDGLIGYGRVAADGDTYEHLGDIELIGASETGTGDVAQTFKLEKSIVLVEGERLAVMEYGGVHPGKIWISTTGTNTAANVRTNIRSTGESKDETWKLTIGIGYVVGSETDALTKLSTPVVTISDTGLASWGAVTNATKYAYSINGANAIETTELSVQLTNGQNIKVKALGDNVTYSNSDYSVVVTYTASEEPEIPDYEVPTETVWYADFTNEQPNFSYNLKSQPGFAWNDTSIRADITGVPINAVKVFATADGTFSLGRGATDGNTCIEALGTITLSGSADVASATAQTYKLPSTIVLNEGEYLIFGRGSGTIGGTDGSQDTASIGVNIKSQAALVRTGFRTTGANGADENWSGSLGVGYVVD